MNLAFSFLLVSAILTGFCILICIVYISYKISQACHTTTLMDADFPSDTKRLNKKSVKKLEDHYNRPTSDTRHTIGLFYSDDDIDILRKKTSPQKFPKGRY